MVALVSGLGGSRKVKIPISSHWSLALVLATARPRMPREASSMIFASTEAPICATLCTLESTTCGAPFITLKTFPLSLSLSVARVNLVDGSKGSYSTCSYLSSGLSGIDLSTRVSMASLAGSFHLAARQAASSTSRRVMPAVHMGKSSCSSILFMVSVPVLSEQSMFMEASSSMEVRRDTMAFSSASMRQPSAIVDVHTTCIAMGMEAMRSTTAKAMACRTSSPLRRRYPRTMPVRMKLTQRRPKVIWRMTFWKWPCSSTEAIMAAVLPKKVSPPVAVTMASISPRVTLEPILALSPQWRVTGSDSPVSAAWSTWIGLPSLISQSAGTAAPAASVMRSPGTSSVASMLRCWPFRTTWHSGLSAFFSAATALPAFQSSNHPTVLLRICSVSSTPKSGQSLMTASMAMAIQIMMAMGDTKASRSLSKGLSFFSASWLGPNLASLRSASSSDNPSGPVLKSMLLGTPQ
mmetsp:Transcript_24214/g.52064  ORF Transcript_24214/g.52064 Transcript_24214/m.52064 type:complete len:465 (-) Transcript_24214:326-1720(-)